MATENEKVIIDLLMNTDARGLVDIVNGSKNAEEQVDLLKLAIQDLAKMSGQSFDQAAAGVARYNAAVQAVNREMPGAMTGFDEKAVAKVTPRNQGPETNLLEIRTQQEKLALMQTQAQLEDASIPKVKEKLRQEQLVHQSIAATAAELRKISLMRPADQIKPLANILNGEMKKGLSDVGQLTKRWQTDFGIAGQTVKNVNQKVYDLKNGFIGAMKEMLNLKAIMNTAFGVGMAMLIFQLQMLFTKFIQDAIKQVQDLQIAINELSAAEVIMSQQGVDVTGKDLLDIVSRLEKVWTNISHTDLLAATGSLALKLADRGVTPEELEQLMNSMLSAQITNPNRTLPEIQSAFSTGLLGDDMETLRQMTGLQTKDVQLAGIKLGYIKDQNDALTNEEKIHAKIYALNLREQKTHEERVKMQENLANSGKKLSAAWENLVVAAEPVVNIWNQILYLLAYALNGLTLFANLMRGTVEPANRFQEVVIVWIEKLKIVGGVFVKFVLWPIDMALKGLEKIDKLYQKISGRKPEDQPTAALLAEQDTPTADPLTGDDIIDPEAEKEAEARAKNIAKWLNDVAEAMDQFGDRARKMQRDFSDAMQKMADDNERESRRFYEDWKNDKEKIIRDSNDKIDDINHDHQRDEIDKEKKFQEELRQLREKYLMSLEDALHERDARQVLRLAREYAMNKQNMINEHNLEKIEDDQRIVDDIRKIIDDRERRLRELDIERKIREARMKEDQDREKKLAEEKHKLEMERLEEEKQDKIQSLTNSLQEQLGLNDEGAKAIYALLDGYFGKDGSIGGMMKYTYESISKYMGDMAKELQTFYDKYKSTMYDLKKLREDKKPDDGGLGTIGPDSIPTIKGMGVRNQTKKNVSGLSAGSLASMFGAGNGSLSLSSGASMQLDVSLSPDLEARIVRKSLDGMGQAIMKVRKSR